MMKLYYAIKYMQIGNFNSEELYQTQVYLLIRKTGKTQMRMRTQVRTKTQISRTIRIINS